MESRLVLNTRQLTPICPLVARVGVARADAANRNRMYYSFYVSLLKKNLQNCKTKNKHFYTLSPYAPRPAPWTSYRIHHIASPTPRPKPPGPRGTPRAYPSAPQRPWCVCYVTECRQEFFQTTTPFIRIWMCDFSTILYIVISLISSVQKM